MGTLLSTETSDFRAETSEFCSYRQVSLSPSFTFNHFKVKAASQHTPFYHIKASSLKMNGEPELGVVSGSFNVEERDKK